MSPRFGAAQFKEEAFLILQPLQNFVSVWDRRGVSTSPATLDVLSAEMANAIMCSNISSVAGLAASP